MRVLLIEDYESTARSIESILKAEGMTCESTGLGAEGLQIAMDSSHDIIILDLMLPDVHGYDVMLRLRSAQIQTPILVLSGLSSVEERIKGLECGAADYLTKPFSKYELLARIKAVVRRFKGNSESVIKFDEVVVNLDTRVVEVKKQQLHLTNKEYAVLELLIMRKGTVLLKETFLNHLYNGIDEPDPKIIDVFVCKLRKKLSDAAGGENYIETIWGRGYMLKDYDYDTEVEYQSDPLIGYEIAR